MAWRAATHQIHLDARRGVVIKRFRSWDRREPAREWTALMLLAECAPGLAPTPVRADLTADPPVIEMSRLPGVPLGGTPLPAAQAHALALALDRLWNAVPRARLTDPYGPGLNASQLIYHCLVHAARVAVMPRKQFPERQHLQALIRSQRLARLRLGVPDRVEFAAGLQFRDRPGRQVTRGQLLLPLARIRQRAARPTRVIPALGLIESSDRLAG